MLRDKNPSKSQYGYLKTRDVPLTKAIDDAGGDEGSLLATLGKLAISAVGMYAGGRMLRGAAAGVMSSATDIVSDAAQLSGSGGFLAKTLKNRLDEVSDFGDYLKKAEGIYEGVDESGRVHRVSALELIPKEQRQGSEYLKKVASTKAAAAARLLPFEIPAAYVVDRMFLDREQLKEDIRTGNLNPKNPLDWASDIASRSVMYATTDLVMRGLGPTAAQAHRSALGKFKSYDAALYSIKRVNAENLRWASANVEKTGVVAKALKKSYESSRIEVMAKGIGASGTRTTDYSLRHTVEQLNPFDKATRAVYAKTASKFLGKQGELARSMNHYKHTGAKYMGTDIQSELAKDLGEMSGQYHIDVDPASGGVRGFGDLGNGHVQKEYHRRVAEQLVEKYDMTEQQAFDVIQANFGRINEDRIASNIVFKANRVEKLGEAARETVADPDTVFNVRMINAEDWAKSMDDTLGEGTSDLIGRDEFIDVLVDSMPSNIDADKWVKRAAKEVRATKKKALEEFGRIKTDKIVLGRDSSRLLGDRSELEYTSSRVLDTFGIQTKNENHFDIFKKAIGEEDTEKAVDALRGLAYSRKIGVERALDNFNILGLKRMNVAEAIELDVADPTKSTLGRHARTMRPATAAAKKRLSGGLRDVLGKYGRRRVGDMAVDKAMYTTISGEVVDLRAASKGVEEIAKAIDRGVKVPLLGFKPTQLIGLRTYLDAKDHRFKYMPGGRNVFAYQEGLDVDKFAPAVKIGKKTWTSDGTTGKIRSIGEWSWLGNDSGTIATKVARVQSGIGKGQTHEQRSGILGNPKVAKTFDINQDVTGSVLHRFNQRLNRSVNIRPFVANQQWFKNLRKSRKTIDKLATRLGFDDGPVKQPDFIPHRFDEEYVKPYKDKLAKSKAVDKNAVERARNEALRDQPIERKVLKDKVIRLLSNQHSEQSNNELSRVLSIIFKGQKLGNAFGYGVVDSSENSLRTAVKTASRTLQEAEEMLPAQVAHLEGLVSSMNRDLGKDLSRSNNRTSLHAKVNSFYMQMAGMARGEEGEKVLAEIGTTLDDMYSRGLIKDRNVVDSAKASVAAARLRLVDNKVSVAGLSYEETIRATQNALKRVVGPAASANVGSKATFGMKQFYQEAAGSKSSAILGLKNVFKYTFGNKNWLYTEDVVEEQFTHTFNALQGSRWVAMRPFTARTGLKDSMKQFGNVITGRPESLVEGDTKMGRALGGMVFSNKTTRDGKVIGEFTTGSIAGWHSVLRIADVLDSIGLGLTPAKYSSPADFFGRGLLMKRALPIYGGLQAIGLGLGIPGIGKDGVAGAAAWGVGPGAGQARAAMFDATGLNEVFGTAAEVMSVDEDGQLRDWSRTLEEERDYWQKGSRPIRGGRYWLLGSNRFKGGKTDYYRPNWYRMFKSDYQYTDDFRGSRAEWAAFGTDVSPGKYLDPYHYERKWGNKRPYPISGDLFTGPWGPMTPILNATLGQVIKPKVRMHKDLAAEQEDALVDSLYMEQGGADDQRRSVLRAYKSGKLDMSDLVMYNDTSSQSIRNVNNAAKRMESEGLIDVGAGNRAVAATMAISMGKEESFQSRTLASVNRYIQNQSGTELVTLGRGGYNKPGLIPAKMMPIPMRKRYDFEAKKVVDPAAVASGGTLGHRAGELGYLTQEWMGIYGFGLGSMRSMYGGSRDFTPKSPTMQGAERGYGAERSFWDKDLGGLGDVLMPWRVNVQMSEITRRFLPHRRRDIDEYNPIPNRMPAWLPNSDTYFMDFTKGDPYTKVKLGEARLPGQGYERLNQLHPDAYGKYGAFDRFKILADAAPWSKEYRYYRDILAKSDMPDALRSEAAEIKRQVAERKKKIVIHPRKWDGKIGKIASGELVPVKADPNLFTIDGLDNPVRLAGVRFAKSDEGWDARREFYDKYLSNRNVKVYEDKERPGPKNNRERTHDVMIKGSAGSLNNIAYNMVKEGRAGMTASQSTAYLDQYVKYGKKWGMVGKAWEAIAHSEIPLKGKILQRHTADEYYERRMVYGKTWQPWEKPVESFLRPFVESTTRPGRGLAGPIIGGVASGILAGAFFDRYELPRAGKFAKIAGAAIGAATAMYRQVQSMAQGQLWVPKRRRREWAIDEYTDILSYVKWSKSYQEARQAAIEREGVDVEEMLNVVEEMGIDTKRKYWDEWENAPVGKKPQKTPAKQVMDSMGPIASLAMEYKKRRDSTMYGADVGGDMTDLMYSLPKRYRTLFNELLETPVSKRQNLLDRMPRAMRRIFESKWGLKIEAKPDLVEYFERHELPTPDWEGWLPEVNLDDVKIKMIKHEGLDHAEFGYYPTQVEEAEAQPWAFPEFQKGTPAGKDDIIEYLSSIGVREVNVDYQYGQGLSGFDMDITHDRRGDIRSVLNNA